MKKKNCKRAILFLMIFLLTTIIQVCFSRQFIVFCVILLLFSILMLLLREIFTEEGMLIRFVVENIFSFDERKEFQMIPLKTLKTLKHHVYDMERLSLLKMASIYGANGSGKSNMIKSVGLLQELVLNKLTAADITDLIFKFHDSEDKSQILAVEFFQENTAFYYGLELQDGIIITEELYLSGLGKKDKLVYERKTDKNRKTTINFMKEFEQHEKNQMLKEVLIADFIKPDETILKLISKRENELLDDVKKALRWFEETLVIIFPESKLSLTPLTIDNNLQFKDDLESVITSLNFGIKSMSTEKTKLMEYLGKNDENRAEKIINSVEKSPKKAIRFNDKGKEVSVIKENEDYFVIKPIFKHIGKSEREVDFDLSEESDGTIRIIDLIPAFKIVSSQQKVFFVDEIERSIHPNLIKELVKEFSLTESTRGQLIFTTHESNLLDQEIFRQDEIWFTEKDQSAATDIYSLSDYKVHKTKDIRSGYLCGRYGSIPFLSNLKDLGWLKNVSK